MNIKDKVDLESLDIKKDKINKLKEVYPEAISEGKVDFEKLRLTLGDEVETGKERYGMNWPGKANCFKIIQNPSKATLKPSKEESIDFDTTENLFIEGDSLEVLKLLQSSYYGKVKMIYIDPPYNTGKDFVYPDNYSESLETYLRYTGQKGKEGLKLSTNTETEGRYHSKWMNMMYVRLFLAKNLLKEDGVIFISIDDHESMNLKKVLDEIFGEESFIADVVVVNNFKGRNDKRYIATANERLFMYVKSDLFEEYGLNLPEARIAEFNQKDDIGYYRFLGLRKRGGADTREARPNLHFPIYVDKSVGLVSLEKNEQYTEEVLPKKSNGQDGCWRWGKETVRTRVSSLVGKPVGNSGRYDVFEKDYLETDGELRRIKPKSVFFGTNYSTDTATKAFNALMPEVGFTNPKPVPFMKDLIAYATNPKSDDIILDFFAGSGTTAHASLNLNKDDDGNRKFIMVQLQEPTEQDSEAFNAGYKNIAEIGKERIRRVIKKINEEKSGKLDLDDGKQDLGFRVFKLDESNFKVWEGEKPEDLAKQLELYKNNVRDDSKPEDILYELILKSGFEISCKVEELEIQGKKVYSIEDGQLMICLEKGLTKGLMKEIAEKEPARVICLDEGFEGNDQLLTNTVEVLKTKGVEFRTV